jgi:ABC transport system ATP-binding/permease protein
VNLVNLEAAAKAFGPRVLLDGVSLGVAAGDRIGVVGRNGAGKSTLLAALAGAAVLDSGRVTRTGGLRVGHLPQSENLTGRVRELVFGALPEHAWASSPRTRGVKEALLGGVSLDSLAEQLSGGERRRVGLAALLCGTHDLLLLDEPTNHLDIEAIGWLAGYLGGQGRTFVVVTHDRWFLDAVCERTWEVADGKVRSYEGSYSAYVLARAERARIAGAVDRRRRGLLRKELAWLRRGPPARTSKPKFRVEAATALIEGEPAPRDEIELTRLAAARLGKTVLEIADATVWAGQRVLLDDVSWQLGPGDRVGVVGVNGSGKTTLLRLLAGMVPLAGPLPAGNPPAGPAPAGAQSAGAQSAGAQSAGAQSAGAQSAGAQSASAQSAGAQSASAQSAGGGLRAEGKVVRGKTVRLGYLTQEAARIDPALRVLEAAEQVRSTVEAGQGELSASQLLERLGLGGETQWTPVGELSGGERRRLQLLMLLMAEPNVLFLDEPTNDLDIETLTELEDLLDGWPGSLVVVSHDRYFLERVTDHVVALTGGKVAYLAGGIGEYLDRRERERNAEPTTARPGAGRAPSAAARQRTGQKELSRLERQLSAVAEQEAKLAAELAASASDYAALIELGAQLRSVQADKASLEERWLELAEELAD